MSDSSAFQTSEYAVQTASEVYYMLRSLPDYTHWVPNPAALKQSVNLYAWSRPTAYWDIQCEWDGTMTRQQASDNYAQEFVNPKMTILAESASLAMEWIGIIGLVCVAGSALIGLKGGWESVMGVCALIWLATRICWVVTLPIIFHRLQVSYETA